MLLGEQSSKSQPLDVKALLDMTTPKAYYLASGCLAGRRQSRPARAQVRKQEFCIFSSRSV